LSSTISMSRNNTPDYALSIIFTGLTILASPRIQTLTIVFSVAYGAIVTNLTSLFILGTLSESEHLRGQRGRRKRQDNHALNVPSAKSVGLPVVAGQRVSILSDQEQRGASWRDLAGDVLPTMFIGK
jgi:hypothetical protein